MDSVLCFIANENKTQRNTPREPKVSELKTCQNRTVEPQCSRGFFLLRTCFTLEEAVAKSGTVDHYFSVSGYSLKTSELFLPHHFSTNSL